MEEQTRDYLKELRAEYDAKKASIFAEHGEGDGFVVEGMPWYDEYRHLVTNIVQESQAGSLTMEGFVAFYVQFGFGPKLYGNSIREAGTEKVQQTMEYLAAPDVPAADKYREVCLDAESDHYVKGLGPNFVTLFLTVLFPQRYGQLNQPIRGALDRLGLLPPRSWGESRADHYERVNEVLLEIAEATGLASLPEVDNLLFCFHKGYIGAGEPPREPLPPEEEPEPGAEEEGAEDHTTVQYYLIEIGRMEGYDVWVARNDRSRAVRGQSFGDLTLAEMPEFANRGAMEIAEYVDVIWFRKGQPMPVRFFEIEATTSIYSGLLRLNDISLSYPIPKATIVLPAERAAKFDREINRATFGTGELSGKCEARTFEEVKARFGALNETRDF